MAYRKYNIEVSRKDAGKAYVILNRFLNQHDITEINFTEQKQGDTYTTTYWFDLLVSDDYDTIKNKFREKGIEMF